MTAITRRDIVKLASALGLAGGVPTAAQHTAAAKVLDQAVSDRIMLDPGLFGSEISLMMGNSDDTGFEWYGSICPEEHSANLRAEQRIIQVFKRHGLDPNTEVGDFESASLEFALAMYDAGLRHGAAFENLRRAVVGETVQCRGCWGTGIGKDGTVCTSCGGTGTVAMKG